MLGNLLIGLPTMALCLLVQATLCVAAIRFYVRRHQQRTTPGFWSGLGVITGVMCILVVGNLTQVTIWGVLFKALGEFPRLTDAVYHSAVNFGTLGYGDIVMSDRYRFLGPLEAINGALMIGVSTAALTAAFQDLLRRSAPGSRG
jgi:hypothetical protein